MVTDDDIVSKGLFYNPTRGSLTLREAIEEICCYLREKPHATYDIIVGCDSSSEEEPSFPVVIVAYRRGGGGRFFLKKIHYDNRKFYSWRERILEEVLISCKMALYLREELARYLAQDTLCHYEFEYIHADVGKNGDTKEMVREITGLIQGNGFQAKIKPESFAASVVADRYT